MARLPCSHFGSIGFSHGALTGSPHTRILQPPSRFTLRLCSPIQRLTRLLTCQAALSQTSTNTRLPSLANSSHSQPRKSSVTELTGLPSTNRSDRYGRDRFGQGCLLARRLVEAGVGLVQLNWYRRPNEGNGWDTHTGLEK